jgi:hypothetical protein
MSTSTPASGGAPAPAGRATRKVATASRKQEPPSDKKKKPLQFRYFRVMKPHRIFALTVEVPGSKKSDGTSGGTVLIIRPVIAGAQVVPAEQRLDTSEAGNQITFHVTPLARGRLSQARVEVFAPGQAPQQVLVPMKVKTQRLAWLLLVLAFVLPWFMAKVTTGDWRPTGTTASGMTDPASLLGQRVRSALREDLFQTPIPLINEPGGLGDFNLVDGLADTAQTLYTGLDEGVRSHRWAPITCVVLLLLSFVSWMFHRTRKAHRRRSLHLGTAEELAAVEPATLHPLAHA